MPDIVMPRLSDSMEEGTILKWLKADGDDVRRGDPLAEIETDKATLTYESDADGVLSILATAGETLPIGAVIARLGGGGGAGAAADEEAGAAADAEAGAPAATDAEAPAATDAGARAAADAGAPAATDAGAPTAAEAPDAKQSAPASPEAPPAAEPAATASATPASEPSAAVQTAPASAAPASAAPAPAAPAAETNGRVKASPLARRIAREQGVDLRAVTGSGPGGRIVKSDVELAARSGTAPVAPVADAPAPPAESGPTPEAPAPPAESAPTPAAPEPTPAPEPVAAATRTDTGTAKGDVSVQELTRTQRLIARRMAESKATVPEFTLRSEIDMEACVQLRSELKALAGEAPVPSYNDMVVKASALALRGFPRANGAYRDGRFELYSRVNVGVAVAAPDALVVPTVFDADSKTLREIAQETRALAERVRAGSVTPPELSGGTFTVSNLGMYGVTDFTAVINPPQAAILAVGALAPRAVVRDGALVARHTMGVTLACDHRILYGADAAQFLARIRALLEQPLALVY